MTTTIDRVFVALSDPTRRHLLETLGGRAPSSATTLARDLPVSRQAVLKHLQVLQDSELVASDRSGREVLFRVRPERLLSTASWMTSLAATWDERLSVLKAQAESNSPEPARSHPRTVRNH